MKSAIIRSSFTAAFSATLLFANIGLQAQEFQAGQPIGATNESGQRVAMSDNVKVFGSFYFSESCVFDPAKNLILAFNIGAGGQSTANDGYVSLINPDGSVHTPKWIGATRDGLELISPFGSAIAGDKLYTVDAGFLRIFDLASGQPLESIAVEGSTFLNGIAVAEDGTAYISNTPPPERIYKVTPNGEVSVFADGSPLVRPNGVAMDNDGNVVVVNIGDNAVLTYNTDGEVINTEYAAEGGNDGVVILEDGTKYVSSVRFGSVSKIEPGMDAEVIAVGIPSAASMCYDSVQNQLVIPLNGNFALAFIPLD